MAYFKGLYCGRMTSTQWSESTNRVLKDSFVNYLTSLHQFAEKMLEALQHMYHIEAGESHYPQVMIGNQLITIFVQGCCNDEFCWLLCRPLLCSIVVRCLMISSPRFTPVKSILSTGRPSIRVHHFEWMKILVYIMGTS
jgi:ascorbate-specific PTS system EIIC-type component UlaA